MISNNKRLAELKRQKTALSSEELDRRGWERYARIQDKLESQSRGDFVMIEVESGDYFVGASPREALLRAAVVYPSQAFCLIRIGYSASGQLKRVQTAA